MGTGGTRGSLSKCAAKYREFLSNFLSDSKDAALAEAIETSKQSLEREMSLYGVECQKAALNLRATFADIEATDAEISKMQGQIETRKRDIEKLRISQPEAKRVRLQKEECEALAKMANARPSQGVLRQRLKQAKADQDAAAEAAKRVNEDLSVREKQFNLLVQCMLDLKESLKEDEKQQDGEVKEDDAKGAT